VRPIGVSFSRSPVSPTPLTSIGERMKASETRSHYALFSGIWSASYCRPDQFVPAFILSDLVMATACGIVVQRNTPRSGWFDKEKQWCSRSLRGRRGPLLQQPDGASGLAAALSASRLFHFRCFRFLWFTPDIARGGAQLLGFIFHLIRAPRSGQEPPDPARLHITLLSRGWRTCVHSHSSGRKGRRYVYRNILVVMLLGWSCHGDELDIWAWGLPLLLLIGYRLYLTWPTVGTAIDKIMKKRWFVRFSVGA